ncbi:MAG: hypothetical protein ACXAC7_04530 [Candidatus Hodarchaeales archaeon]|jgi:cytidine deaminase
MVQNIEKAVKLAIKAKESAIAFRTKVGVCIVTTDDHHFSGANFENSLKKTYHAEEVALIHGLMAGYRNEAFSYMVQLAFAQDEIYPCCLSCLSWLWEYTHPDFVIYTVYEEIIVHQTTLKDLVSGFGDANIFPIQKRQKDYI